MSPSTTVSSWQATSLLSGYYQIRQLVVVCPTDEAARTLVQAFISSRLDYILVCGIADNQLQCLQSVHNAAARLVIETSRLDYMMHDTGLAGFTLAVCST